MPRQVQLIIEVRALTTTSNQINNLNNAILLERIRNSAQAFAYDE